MSENDTWIKAIIDTLKNLGFSVEPGTLVLTTEEPKDDRKRTKKPIFVANKEHTKKVH